MPLPKTGEEFLPLALEHIKDKGIIHLYDFISEEEVEERRKRILEVCQQHGKKCEIRVIKAGQHAPYVWRMCWDIRIS